MSKSKRLLFIFLGLALAFVLGYFIFTATQVDISEVPML